MRNYMAALQSAYSAFRLSLQNPADVVLSNDYDRRQRQYALGWAAYSNDAFSRVSQWAAYAESEGLYLRTKAFENPTTRQVDFYMGAIWQGILTNDGNPPPDGTALAIPFSKDTDPRIRLAVAQSWQWGNWQEEKDTLVMFGGSMGDAVAIVDDDVERGMVYPKVIQPGHVKDVEFNGRGDVIYYQIEYSYYDRSDRRSKTYRQECDKQQIRTWQDIDREPFIEDNPYGFVPMVWIRHRKTASWFGAPAIRSWDKIERLNSLISRIDANIRIHSQSPFFITGEGDATALTINGEKVSENDLKAIKIKGDAALLGIPNNLDIASALALAERLGMEIERDHPETTMYEKMATMSTLTGPAIQRLMGNVEGYVQGARGRYDNQYRKLAQMKLAIGGMRYAQRNRRVIDGVNGWAANTEAQKKFAPFSLESYDRGDLDFSIDSRPLVPQTTAEKWADQMAYFAAKRAGMDAEFPIDYQFVEMDSGDKKQFAVLQKAQNESDMRTLGDGFNAPDTNADTRTVETAVVN
jgi:hypothetical protein